MMQMAIGEGTASTPILSGESPGTHVSGTAINSLTNNALDSSKSEFYPYQLFLSKICEKLKEYIAEYKNYVHIDEYFGMEVLVNANADTQMLAAAPNCYITVVDATGNEDAKEIEAQRYERLLLQQIVPYEIAIQKMNLDNPDEIISLHKKQEPIYNMVKQLEDRPELIPRLIAIVDQMIAQGEIPEQEAPQQPQQMAQ
jgi:coenzyme F420-reducing hydrogenase alpha subunit